MLASLGQTLRDAPWPYIVGGLVLLQVATLQAGALGFLLGLLPIGIAAAFLALARPVSEATMLVGVTAILHIFVATLFFDSLLRLAVTQAFLLMPAALAFTLRHYNSLSLSILIGFASMWISAVILGWLPSAYDDLWAGILSDIRETDIAGGEEDPFADLSMEWLIAVATEMLLATLAFLSSLMLLFARAWQSMMAETPFFAAEFRAMRYGRAADLAFLLTLAAATVLWLPMPFIAGLAATLTGAFLFPGLAAIHRLSDQIAFPQTILVPFYTLLIFVQEIILPVALLGALSDLLGWPAHGTNRSDIT